MLKRYLSSSCLSLLDVRIHQEIHTLAPFCILFSFRPGATNDSLHDYRNANQCCYDSKKLNNLCLLLEIEIEKFDNCYFILFMVLVFYVWNLHKQVQRKEFLECLHQNIWHLLATKHKKNKISWNQKVEHQDLHKKMKKKKVDIVCLKW